MTPAREQEAFQLFDEAVELPEALRDDFLRTRCGDDAALRHLVERMLKQDSQIDERKDLLPGAGAELIAVELFAGPSKELPEQIGQYHPIREIGRGGMGVVYEAEQEEPRRRVALKVIRDGFVSAEARLRFRREAQLLGQLQHPGIAHVYEAGTARVGHTEWPFISMELIDGRPIDKHAESRALSHLQRLELVARVCDAVQHAHVKGVVHRDLKPANILIVDQTPAPDPRGRKSGMFDGVGQPKILDFGVARMIDTDLRAVTLQTEMGQMVGTLSYMSPEQVLGRPDEVDQRSDIYTLGVILFELLAGRLPHDLRERPLPEAARIIRDDEPSQLASIKSTLRGDVDTIVAKALEKDPDRRYQSAAEMGFDIRRFLQHEPILARPAGTVYQLRKFAQRNRVLVGGFATTLISLVAGLIVASSLLVSVTHERDTKQAALKSAEEITRFFTDMLAQATPESRGKDITVVEMIDLARLDLEKRFAGRPLLEARIRYTMGATYVSLSEFDKAAEQLRKARQIFESSAAADQSDLLKTRITLATLSFYQDDYESALKQLDSVLSEMGNGAKRAISPGEVLSLRAMSAMRLGRLNEAERGLEESIRLLTKEHGENSSEVLNAESNLAEYYSRTGSEKTERYYLDLIEQSRAIRGDDHPETLLLKGNLAAHYQRVQRSEDSARLLREVFEGQSAVMGPVHRQTLISANNLGRALAAIGRVDEAREIILNAMKLSIDTYGEESATTVFLTCTLGAILRRGGNPDEAETVLLRAIELSRRVHGPDSEATYRSETELVNHQIARGETAAAIELAEGILKRIKATLTPDHPRFVEIRYNLARALMQAHRFAEAEPLLLLAAKDANAIWLPAVKRRLTELYNTTDRPEEAAKWSKAD